MRHHQARLTYGFLWLVTQLFYFPTWQAGFVTDFTGLLERFEDAKATDILHSFGFPALQQVLNTLLFSWYKLFGIQALPWYLLQTSLHALNAYLLFRLSLVLLKLFELRRTRELAWAAALLFLLNPYASEPVTWRVTQNFLISTAIVLHLMYLCLDWIENPRGRAWWQIQLWLLIGLFTFELSLVIPILLSLLVVVHPAGAWKNWRVLCLPQFVVMLGYFLLHRVVLGDWVGHYGTEVHLRFVMPEMLAHFWQYIFKYLTFARDWSDAWKHWLFAGLGRSTVSYSLSIVGLLVVGLSISNWTSLGQRGRLVLFGFIAFGIALIPVINLHFNYLLHIENDRYAYLASAFFMLCWVGTVSALPRSIFYLLAGGVLILSCILLWKHNQYWHKSTKVYRELLYGFETFNSDTVYLLNLPDNYRGAPMFRDYSGNDSAFRDALQFLRKKPFSGKILEVAQYNMNDPSDGAKAKWLGEQVLQVELNQWGNWWWRRGYGLGEGYSTKAFELAGKGHYYQLNMKERPEGIHLLLQDGGLWKVVPEPTGDK